MCGFDGSTEAGRARASLLLIASDELAQTATILRRSIDLTPPAELDPRTIGLARELELRAQEFAGHVFATLGARPVGSAYADES